MSKLDEIEERVEIYAVNNPDFLYLLRIAREAEKMAKFYGEFSNWVEPNEDPLIDIDEGDKAREFLSFLEKGE